MQQTQQTNERERAKDRFAVATSALLYAVLVDTAVETFRSGSTVRWWVLGVTMACAFATAAFWQQWTWRTKTFASAFAVASMLVVTAWLPSGLDHGLRAVGLTTSQLLSAVAAAGILLAGCVLWRAPRMPIQIRWALGALTIYGTAAFVGGITTGTPFTSLLHGDSIWPALPFLFQSAVIGGFLILPLGLAVSAVSAGLREPTPGSRRRARHEACALATIFAIVLAAVPEQEGGRLKKPLAAAPSSPAMSEPRASHERITALEDSLRAIENGDRESARDRWDPEYVLSQVGHDPQALFDWVHDNTYWIPYRGILRGPVGVLMDRLGNSLDRAMLLAALLQKAGHTVRFAHGELSRDQALRLLSVLITPRFVDSFGVPDQSQSATTSTVHTLGALYQLDVDAIEQALNAQEKAVERLSADVSARVADQTQRLLSMINRPDATNGGKRLEEALESLRDHWWVQRQDGNIWVDFDTLPPHAVVGQAIATLREVRSLTETTSLHHEIAVRVIAEQWSDGAVKERTALEQVLRPAELIGQPIVLQFWPTDWPSDVPTSDANPMQALRAAALRQREWVAILLIGRDLAAQAILRSNGDLGEPLRGGPMAGLGQGIAKSLSDRKSNDSEADIGRALTAVWIEYDIRSPGKPPRTIRRVIFDLLGPAARAADRVPLPAQNDARGLTRSLSLMMRTEMLPLACQFAPEFITHLMEQSLLGSRDVLRAAVRGEISPSSPAPIELLDRVAPPVSPLYSLALARFEWGRFGDQIFIDRPDILTRHLSLATSGDTVVLRDGIDIVANEVGVELDAPDPFAIRLEQGVLDTNSEALLPGGARLGANTAEAFATSQDWVTLGPADDDGLGGLKLPDDARRRIVRDLHAGFVVVAPKAAVPTGSDGFVGWWRIDPTTGDSLGVADNGWGQATSERGVQYNWIGNMAKQFVSDYASMCQWFGAANELRPIIGEVWSPWWVHPSQAFDPNALPTGNSTGCLIATIASGALATLPVFRVTIKPIATRTWGLLRWIEKETWESSAGLRYVGRDPQGLTRVQHVLRHAVDEPARKGAHGVFNAGRRGTMAVIDDAWLSIRKLGIQGVTQGGRTRYIVPMKGVGYQGGKAGAAAGRKALDSVLIIVEENTTKVVTAYPF